MPGGEAAGVARAQPNRLQVFQELCNGITNFADGQFLLWQHLAGHYNLLGRGLKEVVAQGDAGELEQLLQLYRTLSSENIDDLILRYFQQTPGTPRVNATRLRQNACQLVATAAAALAAKLASQGQGNLLEELCWWTCRALTGAEPDVELVKQVASELAGSIQWPNLPGAGSLAQRVFEALAGKGLRRVGAQLWVEWWLEGQLAGRPQLRVPVAAWLEALGGAVFGEFTFWKLDDLAATGYQELVDHPEVALWPADDKFLGALQRAVELSPGSYCWSFRFHENVGRPPLTGNSAGGAAAVALRLLKAGEPYDRDTLVIASVDGAGDLGAVGQEQEKAQEGVKRGIRQVIVAPASSLHAGALPSGVEIRPAQKLEKACQLASGIARELIAYFDAIIELADDNPPPYLGGRKPSELT